MSHRAFEGRLRIYMSHRTRLIYIFLLHLKCRRNKDLSLFCRFVHFNVYRFVYKKNVSKNKCVLNNSLPSNRLLSIIVTIIALQASFRLLFTNREVLNTESVFLPSPDLIRNCSNIT